MAVSRVQQRSHGQGMERYLELFGKSWVETRGEPGTEKYEVRLKPLDEYRYRLERNDHFILIPAEEITDSAEGHPVHMNATNLDEVIKPLGGKTVSEARENNIRAVLEVENAKGREILPTFNHQNFQHGTTFVDFDSVMSDRLFVV